MIGRTKVQFLSSVKAAKDQHKQLSDSAKSLGSSKSSMSREVHQHGLLLGILLSKGMA